VVNFSANAWSVGVQTGTLRSHGLDVHPQVGVAGYFLDLAVVDPKRPGRYILAVECDGATYHSAKSARDRDRLRQGILEGLGWNVHRIWSTDWFRDPRTEALKTVRRVEQLLA
jgi:very-short-patch-repair endonuclease